MTTTLTRPPRRTTRRPAVYVQNPQDLDFHRRFRGYSYEALAKKVGCSKQYVHRLCTSTAMNQTCGDELAIAIAKALDAPLPALFRVHRLPTGQQVTPGRRPR